MNNLKNIKKSNNINKVSIFIYCINDKGQMMLLLGKENNTPYNKTDIELFSEFYGRFINDETIEQATSRIIFEKTMNLLIEPDQFEKIIPTLPYIISYENNQNNENNEKTQSNGKIIFAYKIDYDEYKNIPKYYNRIFAYLNLCTTNNTLGHTYIESCPIGFLDKSELKWFGFKEIIDQNKNFSLKFYKNLSLIIDKITNKYQ